jgi:hypothetical protein
MIVERSVAEEKEKEKERDVVKDLGVMFLCAVAGYGLSQYQSNRKSKNQICYEQVTNTSSLPNMLADKAEEVIRAGGQAGIRRVGALLELVVQNATGDTQIFRQAADKVRDVSAGFDNPKPAPAAAGAAGTGRRRANVEEVTDVEYYDAETDTWRKL